MKKSKELERDGGIFRAMSDDIEKTVRRHPLTEVSDCQRLRVASLSSAFGKNEEGYILSKANNYDENKNVKFELMNIKIVIYGLTGLVCQQDQKRKQKFGKRESCSIKGTVCPIKSGTTNKLDATIAIVSYQMNGKITDMALQTYLPSMPIVNPIPTGLDKVEYTASWPSGQSAMSQEDGAKEQSAFEVTRCMRQASFTPGVAVGSNYCHETLEVGISMSRGKEQIHLGNALIAVNGEEEDEVIMHIPITPISQKSKILKKKKTKNGYFSNDLNRRFFLNENSVLKIGVQVIPEKALRFAREKEKERKMKESKVNNLLKTDDLESILQEMTEFRLENGTDQIQNLMLDREIATNALLGNRQDTNNSMIPNILCGTIPSSWVPTFLKSEKSEPVIPTEIVTDNNLDRLVIHTLISSVSESTDGSDDFFEDYAGEL